MLERHDLEPLAGGVRDQRQGADVRPAPAPAGRGRVFQGGWIFTLLPDKPPAQDTHDEIAAAAIQQSPSTDLGRDLATHDTRVECALVMQRQVAGEPDLAQLVACADAGERPAPESAPTIARQRALACANRRKREIVEAEPSRRRERRGDRR